jgi:hypothetical protein
MWKKDEPGISLSHLPGTMARRDGMLALRQRVGGSDARGGAGLGIT